MIFYLQHGSIAIHYKMIENERKKKEKKRSEKKKNEEILYNRNCK